MKLIIDLFGLWEKLGDEKAMQAAKDAGMEIVEVTQQGEWMSVTARKLA